MATQSISSHAAVTGPAAGGLICQFTVATLNANGFNAGDVIRLDAFVAIAGGASPVDDDNAHLLLNGAGLLTLIIAGASPTPVMESFQFVWDGVHAIQLTAIGAATGTAVYHGTLIATKVDSSGVVV